MRRADVGLGRVRLFANTSGLEGSTFGLTSPADLVR
jgi:hypothetical protein